MVEIRHKKTNAVLCCVAQESLAQAKLAGARLAFADLQGACLVNADLSEACLVGASLVGADMRGANLRRANLSGADLTAANLAHADVRLCRLICTRLQGANLQYANLQHASLAEPFIAPAITGVVALLLIAAVIAFYYARNGGTPDLHGGALMLVAACLFGAIFVRGVRGADLREADLRGTDLRGTGLTFAELADAQHDASTLWPVNVQPWRHIGARRRVRRRMTWAAAAAVAVGAGLSFHMLVQVSQSPREWPRYFQLMQQGYQLERAARYEQAVQSYQLALTEVHTVAPRLAAKGRIAAHNRLGACYRALGERDAALAEFRAAEALGDRVHAPKAIWKLQSHGKPKPGNGRHRGRKRGHTYALD